MLRSAVYRAALCNKSINVMNQPFEADLNGQASILQAARESGVELLLNAIVRTDAEHLYVTLELIDAAQSDSKFVWHREIAISGITSEMEQFQAYLSARFELDIPLALMSMAQACPPANRGPQDDYYIAVLALFSADGFSPKLALDGLEAVVAREPGYASAASMLALVRMFIPELNQEQEQISKTISLARSAATVQQDDCFVLGISAMVMGHLGTTAESGLNLARRALAINPNSVIANLAAAHTCIYLGRYENAGQYLDSASKAGDIFPLAFFSCTARAMLAYQTERYEESLRWAEEAMDHNPTYVIALRYAIASLGQLDRLSPARAYVQRAIQLDPSENLDFFEAHSVYDIADATQHLVEGLRKGGLPKSAALP